ncbi:hypothetical protein NC652_038870 [Populus alba x Populus x berolinensis]|nr:hypothetical protein NC652_038870 [Populus alba x Populus x berolinensis]
MLGGVRLLIKRSTARRFFLGGRTEKKEEKRKPCTAGRIGPKTRGENRSRTHRKNSENSGTTLRHTKKIEEGPEAKTQEQKPVEENTAQRGRKKENQRTRTEKTGGRTNRGEKQKDALDFVFRSSSRAPSSAATAPVTVTEPRRKT